MAGGTQQDPVTTPPGTATPPLLEKLGLAEVTHDERNNRMRAIA